MVLNKTKTLYDCQSGEVVQIKSLQVEGTMRRRLLDLGFVPGACVKVLQRSPMGDPVAYRVSHTTIALRQEESSRIWVEEIGGDQG
ncbi:MAG: ferrous iron transport protein A [Bacillaceae bacterium]|nr:ferrous iron transport protein A [Bacillaceae bacterium]